MFAYRALFGSSFVIALGLVAFACGSDDSGSGGNLGPFEPAGNGQPMAEKAACEALKKARAARIDALKCGPVTEQPCPTYIQSGGHEPCSQYDEGTVTGCVAFITSLTSCNEVLKRECIVKTIPGSAPLGCETLDAGSDAGSDAGQDATSTDAGTDVLDAELDVAIDAPLAD